MALTHAGYDGTLGNLKTVSGHLVTVADSTAGTLDSALEDLKTDPNNPAKLANFQASVNEYSVVMSLVATVQKSIKDAMSTIVQKMG
ncbi:type III secretion system needle filament subunit SctF [Pseudoalteromonas sp. XMcav1-K]|uniref:type III secretion system needle filament subunit SctF n=1 Tax=Pseudoalteromonas sp. XMcav1-K TaxID=3374372 RepID=UPI00375796D1